MTNGLNPDQDCRFVSPDLVPKCLQRLLATSKEMVNQQQTEVKTQTSEI